MIHPARPGWMTYYKALTGLAFTLPGWPNLLYSYVTEDGLRLGEWICTQRCDYRGGTLLLRRQHWLELLPGWGWSAWEEKWRRNYAALEALCDHPAFPNLPARFMTPQGLKLGAWSSEQRKLYRDNLLPPAYAARLERLEGWLWEISPGRASPNYSSKPRPPVAAEMHATT